MVRRIMGATLALVAAAGLTVVAASPASASALGETFATPSGRSCLDGYNRRPGGEVYTTDCNNGPFQKFNWLRFNTRTQLASRGVSNYCIQKVGSKVRLESCHPDRTEQFWLVQGRPGSLVIRSDADPTVCLTRSGSIVDVGNCSLGVAAWVLR